MTERTLTFIVTESCQLRCKYCYLVGKNDKRRMSLDIAKQAVKFIFKEPFLHQADKVIFDFIGGEPLLEIDLISETMNYAVNYMLKHNHKWLKNYEIRITTNGLLYNNPKVQTFIQLYKEHLSISISIDGNKNKNDVNRIFPNGKGSYDNIIENVHLWIKQFPDEGTKMTISHKDIPYLYESLKHLVDIGITKIDVNPIVENVWENGDGQKFEEQLLLFADYIIENNLWQSLQISAFEDFIGHPIEQKQKLNPCGTMSLSIDGDGNLYSCIRFVEYSLRDKLSRTIGNIFEGLDKNKIRADSSLFNDVVSPTQCLECEIASGCKWCPAESYDSSTTGSIQNRTTFHCELHRAKVRAKNYYYNKLKSIGYYHDRY